MPCTPAAEKGPGRSTDFTILVHPGGFPRFEQFQGYAPGRLGRKCRCRYVENRGFGQHPAGILEP